MKFLGILLISIAALVLEVLQMRIYSLAIWHHLAYMVITVALLGFSAAGSALVAFPSLAPSVGLYKRLSVYAALFSVSVIIAFIITGRLPLDTFQLLPPPNEASAPVPIGHNKIIHLVYVFIYYLALLPPYFFAGLIISSVFIAERAGISKIYFYNLLGSALGSFGVVALIAPVTGEGLIIVVAALGLIASLAFILAETELPKNKMIITAVALLGAVCVLFPVRDYVFVIKVAETKALGMFEKFNPTLKHEYKKWDPIARIDVVGYDNKSFDNQFFRESPSKVITIDGDAFTFLFSFPKPWPEYEPLSRTMYSSAYFLKPEPEKVLIVGLGGGIDVATALHHKAKDITAVEINSAMIDATGRAFAEWDHNLYQQPQVKVVHSEGRSFLKRDKGKYDVIQMSGVDTWSGVASGAYVLSENYLYTVEAMREYLSRLNDDGVLCVIRWLFFPPRETLRLASVAAEALKTFGVKEPDKHIAVITHHMFGAMLIKLSPFTPKDVEAVIKAQGPTFDGSHLGALVVPTIPGNTPFHEMLALYSKGDQRALDKYFEDYRFNITPVFDDKPFFFSYYKWRDFFGKQLGAGGSVEAMFPVGFWVLLLSLVQAAIFSVILILLPVYIRKKREVFPSEFKMPFQTPVMFYFACLGIGFMTIEIALMQKLVLYLGHPSYSIAVTLATLLLFSGLGSLFIGGIKASLRTLSLILPVLAVVGIVDLAVILPKIAANTLGAPFAIRTIIAVSVIAPIAFLMGMPFPLAMRMLGYNSMIAEKLIPWAFAANGAMSVVASIGAIALAMALGFNAVLLIGFGFYALAYGCVWWWRKS